MIVRGPDVDSTGRYEIGVRPERIEVIRDAIEAQSLEPDGYNVLPGTVAHVPTSAPMCICWSICRLASA